MKFLLKWGVAAAIFATGALLFPTLEPLRAAKNEAEIGARIEMMDFLPASKIARGLGFNLKYTNEWEFDRAREAGATEARMQFDWPDVEKKRGQLQLTPAMERALDLCRQNDLEPLILAVYAPRAVPVAELTVSEDVPAGALQIPVSGADLPLVKTPASHVLQSDGTQIVAEGRWAYYGALIDKVDTRGGTLQLAAKTNVDLPRGTFLRVNQLFYPSLATQNANEESLMAYGRYARFLAQQIAARGLKGRVELWNEPPWNHDRWDARGGFYDTVPSGINAVSPNPGMLDHFLQGEAPPRRVSFVWGGSHKSGGRGLGARREKVSAAQLQRVSDDAFHPYGDAPESHAWNPQALRAGAGFDELAPVGTNPKSNLKVLRQKQVAARNRGDLAPGIVVSEVGQQGSDEARKARYNLRAFLTYLSLGIERVNFYRLADKPGKYGFISGETPEPQVAYRSFKTLMAHVNSMPTAPADGSKIPQVRGYSGTFPLTVIPIGARGRWLMVSYQRTFASPPQKWPDVAVPAQARVEMSVPRGYRVIKAWNLVSDEAINFVNSRGVVSYNVSHDPIALDFAAG